MPPARGARTVAGDMGDPRLERLADRRRPWRALGTADALLDRTLRALLADSAVPEPAPGGAAVPAVAVAMAAALVAAIGRASDPAWPDAREAAAHADRLRRQCSRLAADNATRMSEAVGPARPGAQRRLDEAHLAALLDQAADIPAQIAEVAADVAALAHEAAASAEPEHRADAAVAAVLAAAAASAAAHLVAGNLLVGRDDPRLRAATAAADRATDAAERASAVAPP
jgi:methenyltetrahydrofolate cyclohydrolase